MSQFRRRILLINRPFQIRFAIHGYSKPGATVYIYENGRRLKTVKVKKGAATYKLKAKKGTHTYTVYYPGTATVDAVAATRSVKVK